MEIDIGLNNPLDLLKKAEREKERLFKAGQSFDQAVFADHLFNFAVTMHHLGDWVVRSDSGPITKENVLDLVSSDKTLQACKDICNSVKHFKIDRYEPTTDKVRTSTLSIAGTISAGSSVHGPMGVISNDSDKPKEYEYDEINLSITMSDGEIFDLNDFCGKAISTWSEFLERHGNAT
ncbi:MAG: hypothetical protein KAS48_08825 [Gammaproteobacteria bacterium]|nr:hypothetical protein [Gammaproteobacteria bacterium]MCK5091115.1 hypothetical protein [Gammaproteobacteria bacterium]